MLFLFFPVMRFHVLTLFPEMFRGFLDSSVIKRGQECGAISVTTANIRDFSTEKHKRVDAPIFGGGAGMLLRPEPVAAAIRDAKRQMPKAKVIYMSPGGEIFSQKKAEKWRDEETDLIFLCGRYEGVDQRIRATMIDEEISIGEYVLSGGELPAAVVIDAVARLVPGVLGTIDSVETESFSRHLFRSAEFPQFTRPRNWEGMGVPEVLLSGNHQRIFDWQLAHLPGLSEAEERVLAVRRKILPIKTRNLFLRNYEESDIDAWVRWFNDEEVTRYLRISPPLTREDEEEYFEETQCNLFCLPISICEKKTKKPIGNMRLTLFPEAPHRADFGIVIGEKKYWKKGVCKEAVQEMLRLGFEELGIHVISLVVDVRNVAAQKCYEACGFRCVGKREKEYEKNGMFYDSFLYEVVKS